MKTEYFIVALQINELFYTNDPTEVDRLLADLKHKVKRSFIRFEVFYEPEFYEADILNYKKELFAAVTAKDYETAARLRSRIKYLLSRRDKCLTLFINQTSPCCIIDENGLAKCFFHSTRHASLVESVKKLSWSKNDK